MKITLKVTCKDCGCSFQINQAAKDSPNYAWSYAECPNCHSIASDGNDYTDVCNALRLLSTVPDEITGSKGSKFAIEVYVPEKPEK